MLPWSSGIVEGHVNRLKMLKRQMFGRAKPDPLPKRVLLTEKSWRARSRKACQNQFSSGVDTGHQSQFQHVRQAGPCEDRSQ